MMHSHRFDPISAVLGLIALVAGIIVMAGATVPFEADIGPWLALVALAFGIVLLPWGMRRTPRESPDPTPETAPEPDSTTFA